VRGNNLTGPKKLLGGGYWSLRQKDSKKFWKANPKEELGPEANDRLLRDSSNALGGCSSLERSSWGP